MTVLYSTWSCLRSNDVFEHLSAGEIIDELVLTAAYSGNLLLNDGPTGGLITWRAYRFHWRCPPLTLGIYPKARPKAKPGNLLILLIFGKAPDEV